MSNRKRLIANDRTAYLLIVLSGLLPVLSAESQRPLYPIAQFYTGSTFGGDFRLAVGDLDGDGDIDMVSANFDTSDVSLFLGNGQGLFEPAVQYGMSGAPRAVALADLDGDGYLDVFTANGNSRIAWRLNDGLGGLGPVNTQLSGGSALDLLAVDLNHDSLVDVVTANVGADTVSVLLGNDSGGFGAPSILAAGDAPGALDTADMNGDSHPDLIVVNRFDNSMFVYLGDGSGGFGKPSAVKLLGGGHTVRVQDVNGDLISDAIVNKPSQDSVLVLFGAGDGTFSNSAAFPVATAAGLALADLNNDGADDIITAADSVLLGDGKGGFSPAPFSHSVNSSNTQFEMAVADLNGDGIMDLAIPDLFVTTVLGNGDGSFEDNGHYQVASAGTYQVLLWDLNHDGALDVIASHLNGTSVALGDGSGAFDAATLFGFGGGSGGNAVIADLTGDGEADLACTNGGPNVQVIAGLGNGDFGEPIEFDASEFTVPTVYSVGVGHLNSDGLLDIVTGLAGQVSVLLGDPMTGFSEPQDLIDFTLSGAHRSVIVRDLDHDGQADILAAVSGSNNRLHVVYGDGSGGGTEEAVYPTPGTPYQVVVSDLNADGQVDVATAAYTGGKISVRLGAGRGAFGAATNYDAFGPRSLALGDINGDGIQDLVAANFSTSNFSVRYGDGKGNFGEAVYYAGWSEPHSVALGDVNSDGRLDVVVANYFDTDSGVTVSLGKLDVSHGRVVLGSHPTAPPMGNVLVEALDPKSLTTVVASTYTNQRGEYRLDEIPDGSWIIRTSVLHSTPSATQISNYPDYDLTRLWAFEGGEPIYEVPVIRFPSPVVFHAGFWASGASTWDAAVSYFSLDQAMDVGKRLNHVPAFLTYVVSSYDDNASSVDDHDKNGKGLRDFIDSIDLNTWVQPWHRESVQFSLMAHSMGGIITRAMVTQYPSPNDIPRIVNLDSPHGGTDFARDVPILLSALKEEPLNGLRQAPCGPVVDSGWNASHVEPVSSTRRWLLYSAVPNYIVWPDASAHGRGRPWISPNFPFPGFPFPDRSCSLTSVNGWEVEVGDSHGGIHDTIDRLRESALFLSLGTLPSQNPPAQIEYQAGSPTQGLGFSRNSMVAGAGSAGMMQAEFDPNNTVYGRIIRRGESAMYTLTDASGSPLSLRALETVELAPGALLDRFEVQPPPVGPIEINLLAGPEERALYATFYFDNGVRALLTTSVYELGADEVLYLQARLVNDRAKPLTIATGTCVGSVLTPSGALEAVVLYDDGAHNDGAAGDGLFGGALGGAGVAARGRYHIDVTLRGSYQGHTVERSADASFVILPEATSFVGGIAETAVDADFDGKFDWLLFDQTISLLEDGEFSVVADLLDGAGATITSLSRSYENGSGATMASVRLSVAAAELSGHGVDGPWELASIRLVRLDASSLPTATRSNYLTEAYGVTDFAPLEPPLIAGLFPSQGRPRGGDLVTLVGSGLLGTTEVRIGGQVAEFVVQDDQSVVLTVPRLYDLFPAVPQQFGQPSAGGDLADPRYCSVRVVTPWGFDQQANAFAYSPSAGAGDGR